MTIAIKRQNGDLIWFDAVTEYSQSYRGSVSSNPMESGAKVTDHVTIDNPVITIRGIISDADFNLFRPIITDAEAKSHGINNKEFVNNQPVSIPAQITTTSLDIAQLLPDSVGQFVAPEIPQVTVFEQERPKFAATLERELRSMQREAEEFSILDFRDGVIWESFDRCILTSLEFLETPDTGQSLQPSMTIEQVTYTDTRTVQVQINKGRKTGKTDKREKRDGDDKNENTQLSNKDAGQVKKSQAKILLERNPSSAL